jgi:hypothetical protein
MHYGTARIFEFFRLTGCGKSRRVPCQTTTDGDHGTRKAQHVERKTDRKQFFSSLLVGKSRSRYEVVD